MRTVMSSIDPAVEERLTQARTRALHDPVGQEALVRGLLAAVFLSCAIPLALLADKGIESGSLLAPTATSTLGA